jgi:hypothetical protein
MPRQIKKSKVHTQAESQASNVSVPAEAALSFLKETRGIDTWTIRDLADSMKVSSAEAKHIATFFQIQGYAQPRDSEWTTTASGYIVSGSRRPRFVRESVELAIKKLSDWMKVINEDSKAAYRITAAVAFGDFMQRAVARVQSADVCVRLEPRSNSEKPGSAKERKSRQTFLKDLRGRSAMLKIRPYEEWMSKRFHLRLI